MSQILLAQLLRSLLTIEEEEQITEQLNRQCRPDSQVLWSGIPRETAQAWADKMNLQTLTTAMGPLMDSKDPLCLRSKKSPNQWSAYVKGASALFARHITKSSKVVVLSQPPPRRFNPCGHTNYQLIEEPIVKGMMGGGSVECIQMVHPTVKGAEDFIYEGWPLDRTEEWIGKFPHPTVSCMSWRTVKMKPEIRYAIQIFTLAEQHSFTTNVSIQLRSEEIVEKIATTQKSERASHAAQECIAYILMFFLKGCELQASLSQDKTNDFKESVEAQRRKNNERRAAKRRARKAKRKQVNEENTLRQRMEKAAKKEANKEIALRQREEKARKKQANVEKMLREQEEKARKKQANEEKAEREREEKTLRKIENARMRQIKEEMVSRQRDEKAKRKQANKEIALKQQEEKARRKQAEKEVALKQKEEKARAKKAKEERAARQEVDEVQHSRTDWLLGRRLLLPLICLPLCLI
jgi:hypothetical protein